MGLIFYLIRKVLKLSIYFLVFSTVVVLIPNLPPYTTFSEVEIDPLQPLVGPLAINEELNGVEKLYENKLLGPEAFSLYNGEVYTGLATGQIVKLSPAGDIKFVTKIGESCSGLKQEHICGRPLGLTIDEKSNQMYVADAYHGIWKVDLKRDKKQLLVSPNVEINGHTPKLFNSVALDSNGNLYWTDSTTDFQLKDGSYTLLTDPTGRLFSYDASKNVSKVLLDKIYFANGLAVSPDNQFVVVAETFAFKLIKYYINGPRKGQSETFVSGLPGTPDNVRPLPDGSGVLVGLYTVFDDANRPVLIRSLAMAPYVRKFIARIQRLIELSFEFLAEQFSFSIFDDIVYKIGHFKSTGMFIPKVSGLIQIDWNGNIVATYYNTDGSIEHCTDAVVFNDKLFMGEAHSHKHVAAVPAPPALKIAFTPKRKVEAKVESPKTAKSIQEAQEKPVEVTTPKPVVPKTIKPVATPQVDSKPKAINQVPKTEAPKVQEKREASQEACKTGSPKAKEIREAPKEVLKTVPPKAQEKREAPKEVPRTVPPEAQKKREAPKEVPKSEPPKVQEKKEAPKEVPKSEPSKVQEKKEAPVEVPKPAKKVQSTTPKPTGNSKQQDTQIPAAKPVESKMPPPKHQVKAKPAQPHKDDYKDIPQSKNNAAPEQIPIKEEIPSDTRKPNKETLKVIKKDGPTEIPNPNL